MSRFAGYHVLIDGEHVLSCAHFGDANRAAFDDLAGFDPLAGAPRVFTAVVNRGGQTLATYELNRGRLARPLDNQETRP